VFVQYVAVCHYRRFVCVSGAPVRVRSGHRFYVSGAPVQVRSGHRLYVSGAPVRVRSGHRFYVSGAPVQVRSGHRLYACGRSPAEIVGSNPTGGMDICLL